jgi:signal transduction histidine kinase
MQKSGDQLAEFVSYLASRRTLILQSWRSLVDSDPELTAPTSLPRTQFNDHIPELLDAYEQRLLAWPSSEAAALKVQRKEDASSHGLLRWQQGYHLREVTREWGHLQTCLADELNNYAQAHPELESTVLLTAWRALAELCSQGISESTTQYFQLEQSEAEGHVRDMEETLAEVRELERRRSEMFRQAAHDLRGNVGVVKNVTTGLSHEVLPAKMREDFLKLLQRSVSSLHSMLDEVMDLARLQAGHELRNVKPLDIAVLLRELFQNLEPLALERGLYLKAEGLDSLPIEGDAVKIGRIAQNLLLNALKYTREGGVTLVWGDSRSNDPKRWMLSIQDTGPGFHAGPGAPLVEALKDATVESRVDTETMTKSGQGSVSPPPTSSPDLRPVQQMRGEGIGLSIVKRLCELLDATLEVESQPGMGSTFRVVLPRSYNAAEQKK